MERKLFWGQYMIWVILLLGHLHGCKSCIEKERKALWELKTDLVSRIEESRLEDVLPTWTNDTKSDCCRWEGIKCNRTSRRVIELSVGVDSYFEDISPLNLSLLHPFEEIRSLNLCTADYNQFSGFFDDVEGYRSLSRLRNLQILDLSSCAFNNSIFPFLNAATSLTTLSLRDNHRMGGTFPIKELKNLTNLELLDLSQNYFSGSVSVICKMKNLRELNLRGNHFVGPVPVCLGSLHKLRVLDLSSNQFSGNLPSSFRSLESLEYLSLLENNFTGSFSLNPLTNLTKLKVFKLSLTSDMIQVETESTWQPEIQLRVVVLRSCGLEKIPSFLLYQKNLRLVDLSSNRLSGAIPTWLLANNTELDVLKLQSNSFTIFQMPTMMHNLHVLDFSTNDISGLFPDNIGRSLPNLVFMNGSNNDFQGHFPSSMGEMKNISVLDLSYNNFSGELPQSFLTGCVSLEYLKLSHNKFSGHFLPRGTSFFSLIAMRVDNNLFSGNIGVGLNSSTELMLLDMSNNRLTGDIPSWFSNLSNSLEVLLLSNNFLEGSIPPYFQLFPFLSFLDLSENQFSGTLPSSVSSEFGSLFLSNNNFTGSIPEKLLETAQILDLRNNKLSGSIPQSVSHMSILLLKGNNLAGSIPRQLCNLRGIISLLDLSDNNLSGSIPSCLYNLSVGFGGIERMYEPYMSGVYSQQVFQSEFYKSTFLIEKIEVYYNIFQETKVKFATKQRYDSYYGDHFSSDSNTRQTDSHLTSKGILGYMFGMDLSNNKLSGVIPPELGNLSKLQVLNLSHNYLSSSIPSSFSNLTDIESLDLSHNKLQGSIPQQLTSLTSLAVLDVSYNNLSGIIPQGKQFSTFNENCFFGNPLLCGLPTNRSCEANKSSEEAGIEGEEEYDEAPIDMLVFYFSTASTYVVALISILVLMCFDSPWRRAWLCIVDACIASAKSMFS